MSHRDHAFSVFKPLFLLGCLVVFMSAELSYHLGTTWVFYFGCVVGLILCGIDIVRAFIRTE